MQLVKNAFESEKTVSRKLEEILVYILENNRIVSKERMLEVYFNIIEWGPNVYGIGEASQFYFQNAIRIIAERMLVSRPNYSKSKSSCISLTIKDVERFCCKTRIVLTNIMFRRGLLT
jgi:membrane carboxypeptidase/penicillin-binding protein